MKILSEIIFDKPLVLMMLWLSVSLHPVMAEAGDTIKLPRSPAELALEISKAYENRDTYGLARLYFEKGDYYYYRYSKDSAFTYYRKSLQESLKAGQDTLAASNYYSIGHLYFETDVYDSALYYADKAQELGRKEDKMRLLIAALKLKAEVYNYQGKNERAISTCVELIQLYDSLDYLEGKSDVLNIIGSVYINLKAFDKAEKYLREAAEIAIQNKNYVGLSITYSSLGTMFIEMEDYARSLDYLNKCFEIDQILNDSLGLGFTLFSQAKALMALDSLETAEEKLRESLFIAQRVNDNDLLCNVHAQIGSCLLLLGALDEAPPHFKKAEFLAKKINALPILQVVYKHIADYYEQKGDYFQSLQYLKSFQTVTESIRKQENARKIAEIESVYELAEKEKQIALLTKKNEIHQLVADKQKLLTNELLVVLCFIAIISIVLYNRNRIKTRTNKVLEKQKEAINQQKEEIERQKDDIQAKSSAIAEINLQMTDSIEYAKKIQTSLFADKRELEFVFPQSFIIEKPRDIISGDFYWVTSRNDDIYLAVVDCTGHGVPGAFMTILANSLLNQIILENQIQSPDTILSLLDIKIKQNLLHHSEFLSADGMDIALCKINKADLSLSFAGARMPLYYIKDKKLQQIKGDRYPIGSSYYENKTYHRYEIQMQAGDMLYLCSDGYYDQFGGDNDQKFLRINFKRLISQINGESIKKQSEILEKTFQDWKGDHTQTDDILIMGIRL